MIVDDKKDYFVKLKATEPILSRIKECYDAMQPLCPEEFENIAITDIIEANGSRVFDSLYFLAPNYLMEAKRFVSEDAFDIIALHKGVAYLQLTKENYSYGQADERSRINVLVGFKEGYGIGGMLATFRGSGPNCDHIFDLVKSYFMPRLK